MSVGTEEVAVVIVTYQSAEFVPRLSAGLRGIPFVSRVTVVDNSPDDATATSITAASWGHPMELITRRDNPGFGAAVNAAAFSLRGSEYLVIVNPDVLLEADALNSLLDVLRTAPGVAAVGARMQRSDGEPVSSARRFPSLTSIVRRSPEDVDHRGLVADADWICGALMVWRMESFLQLEGFDESYFLYYEDVDICQRAWTAGNQVKIAGGVVVIHDQGHGVETSPYLRRVNRESRRRYASRWLGRRGRWAAHLADAVELTKAAAKRALR